MNVYIICSLKKCMTNKYTQHEKEIIIYKKYTKKSTKIYIKMTLLYILFGENHKKTTVSQINKK